MNILVLQPIRPSNPPLLRARADILLARLEGANPGMTFDIYRDDSAIPIPPHPSIYMRHATVRNYMLDTYLKPEHTHVLWIDSDLIDYPANLPTLLHEAAPGAICAPLVLLSETSGYKNRFYDIGGFIEHGNRARMAPPWFDQASDVIELDSVGCCYLAPADLYRDRVWYNDRQREPARYVPPLTDYYVEHWSVMQQAKRRGCRICCLTTARAIHAWLPDYGLEPS